MRTVCVGIVLAAVSLGVPLRAQEAAQPDTQAQAAQLREQIGTLERQLHAVRQRLGIFAARERRGGTPAPEIAPLLTAAETAGQAYEAKVQEKVLKDPEGAKLVAQLEEARGKIDELRGQIRESEQGLAAVKQRLGLALSGREQAAGEDAETAALRKAAQEAHRAVEEKMREMVKADPEGAKLLGEIEQLRVKLQELQPSRGAGGTGDAR